MVRVACMVIGIQVPNGGFDASVVSLISKLVLINMNLLK